MLVLRSCHRVLNFMTQFHHFHVFFRGKQAVSFSCETFPVVGSVAFVKSQRPTCKFRNLDVHDRMILNVLRLMKMLPKDMYQTVDTYIYFCSSVRKALSSSFQNYGSIFFPNWDVGLFFPFSRKNYQ